MHLIHNHRSPFKILKEGLRVFHHFPDAGQFAIEMLDVRKTLAEHRLANATNTRKPEHRAFLQSFSYLFKPEMSFYHLQLSYHLVIPNATRAAIRFLILSLALSRWESVAKLFEIVSSTVGSQYTWQDICGIA